MAKQEQGKHDKLGLRWYAITSGKTRVVWGHTKALAIVAAKRVAADHGDEFIKVEPAPRDFRNEPRGGSLDTKLTILMSSSDYKRLKDAYGKQIGEFSDNLRKKLLDGLPPASEEN
jgi:hypothetical protein